jgi:hypothetical protein
MNRPTLHPWTVKEDDRHGQEIDGPLYDIVGANGETVALHIASEADARLMAAAPKLLAALKHYAEHGSPPLHQNPLVDIQRRADIAHAAIAEAEGR